MPIKVTILDYRCGNIFNLVNAVREIGLYPHVATHHQEIKSPDVIILGGVGAFDYGMQNIKSCGFQNKIIELINSKTKNIGICLGAQLMLTDGEEFKKTKGLNFVKGHCTSLKNLAGKIPATGWYQVSTQESLNFKEFNENFFYFNHSYHMLIDKRCAVQSTYTYYQKNICACFENKNLIGFQFHPEKSGTTGLKILKKAIYK